MANEFLIRSTNGAVPQVAGASPKPRRSQPTHQRFCAFTRLRARVRQKIGNCSILKENLLYSSGSRFELQEDHAEICAGVATTLDLVCITTWGRQRSGWK